MLTTITFVFKTFNQTSSCSNLSDMHVHAYENNTYIYVYTHISTHEYATPLMYPRFVLESSGNVVASRHTFPISTSILGRM